MEETEKLKTKSVKGKNGGAREGAGRKKGSMNAETVEKLRVLAEVRQRIHANAERLLNAHMNVALGASFLFRIYYEGTGKNRKKIVEQVEDPYTIKAYLDGEFEGSQDEYYYITTQKPDAKAIESLFDRAFGKSVQAIEGNLDINYNNLIENLDDEYNASELEQT